MGLYKYGNVWYYTMYVNGRRVRRSTGVSNRRVAEDIYSKARIEIREGRYFQQDQSHKKTFRDMTIKYMAEYAIKKAPKSMLRDTISLKHLLPVFGTKLLSQITANQVNSYKVMRRNEGASASSINKELAFAKHSFNIAIRTWEWIKENPFIRVSMEKLPAQRVRYLTAEEFDRLYNSCNERLKPIVLLAAYTGMRKDNILSLTWQQVDINRGVITLEHTKNGERLGLPMHEQVKELLSKLKRVRHISSFYVFNSSQGTKIDESKVGKWFRQALRESGIENFRFHDLRHTFASWLVQNGVDLYRVQQLLGHKTGDMTRRYAHLAPDNLRTAINSLNHSGTAIKTAIGVKDESHENS